MKGKELVRRRKMRGRRTSLMMRKNKIGKRKEKNLKECPKTG
jgi:hypothetical protein